MSDESYVDRIFRRACCLVSMACNVPVFGPVVGPVISFALPLAAILTTPYHIVVSIPSSRY